MELHQLPDLSGWLFVEVWTLEEAAMLWAAIDPADHVGKRLHLLTNDLPPRQYRKAWMSLRAVSEAVSGGTLPFVDAWELHDDYQNGPWESKVDFPALPDPNKLIPEKTRVRQAAFRKWADTKRLPSYRQDVIRLNAQPIITAQLTDTQAPAATETLILPMPDFRDPGNPLSPIELRASIEIWEIVTSEAKYKKGMAVKDALKEALNNHPEHRELSTEAKNRISTVTNWNKKGGAPNTPGG